MTELQKLRAFLYTHLEEEFIGNYGVIDRDLLDHVSDAWLNDESNSAWRFQEMSQFIRGPIPKDARILDMASGCGTFVFYGLRRGFDVWGIDPEEWKQTFNCMKVEAYHYPREWRGRFVKGVGEALPFSDCSFDYVSSYQTIEHVHDVAECLREMMRVLKPGGVLFLRAPDYRGTFEGHYQLPWMPLFPRGLARLYLWMLGRPVEALSKINYVTAPLVRQTLRNEPVKIIERRVKWRRLIFGLFRREMTINMIVVKDNSPP